MSSPVYRYAVSLDPSSRGLDPKTFVLTIGAQRADGEAMSEADLQKVRAALAADKASGEKSAPKASKGKTPKPPAAAPKASAKGKTGARASSKAAAKDRDAKHAKRSSKAAE